MMNSATVYGIQPQIPGATAGVSAPTAGMSLDYSDLDGWRALVDPHNPLFVLGVILAITFGAAGVSGSAKVGPARVAGSLGDSD